MPSQLAVRSTPASLAGKTGYNATMTQTYDNAAVSASRLPPRQQVTRKFPVVGEREPVPEALDVRQWRLRVTGEVQQPQTWTYDELLRLPQVEVEHDIHCVTRWSRLGCRWRGVALTTVAALVSPTPAARFVQFIAYSQPARFILTIARLSA